MSTSSPSITAAQRDSFYAAAVAGLRALDARERSPRRFGADPDTRWSAFRGNLNDADRIDMLLRDAATTWGAAFSPAESFGLFGLAPDEPFGPDWQPLGSTAARRALAEPARATSAAVIAGLLSLNLAPVSVPLLTPSTRVAVSGPSAMVALAGVFAGQQNLSWSDQVLAVASAPAHRQLAALLAIAVGAASRTRLVRPSDDLRTTLKGAGFAQIDLAVVSADADPSGATFAQRAAGAV